MEIKQWKDVLTIISGKDQKEVANPNGKYPIYGSGGPMGYANAYLCEAGTTIIGRKGTINKPIFVNEPFWNIDTAFGLVAGPDLDQKYLYYFCEHFNFMPLDKSTGRPSLAKSDLLKIEMPIPSLIEQKRVVSRIEEMLSQLDAGVETLKNTKAQLAVYRQAVLKEAFDVAASVCRLQDVIIGSPQNGIYKPQSDYIEDGIPILRIDGFYDGFIRKDYLFKRVRLSNDEIAKYSLNIGDLIINRVNSMSYLGKCALVREIKGKIVFESNMMRIKLDGKKIDGDYLCYYLSSYVGRKELTKNAKQAVNQASINQTDVGNVIIPCPNLVKQKQISLEIEARLSVYDSIEQTVNTALQQAEALRQSILKQAFEGRL